MNFSLAGRLPLHSYPWWVRLLALVLSLGWLGAAAMTILFMGYMLWLPGAPGPPISMFVMIGTVFFLATAGYAALVRVHRWVGLMLLLGACGLGACLVLWAGWGALVLGLIYEG